MCLSEVAQLQRVRTLRVLLLVSLMLAVEVEGKRSQCDVVVSEQNCCSFVLQEHNGFSFVQVAQVCASLVCVGSSRDSSVCVKLVHSFVL